MKQKMVEFCPNCEAMLKKAKKDGAKIYKCGCCGFEKPLENILDSKIGEYEKKRKEMMELQRKTLVLEEGSSSPNPIAEEECPKCGHSKVEFHQLQILAGDEPTTTFFRCLKCGLVWRHEV